MKHDIESGTTEPGSGKPKTKNGFATLGSMFEGRINATILSGLTCGAFMSTIRRRRCASKAPLLAIFGELDTPEAVKANVRAIRQILDQAGRRDYTVKVYPKWVAQPDGDSTRQSQRVCPPQTIPTGFLRNDG